MRIAVTLSAALLLAATCAAAQPSAPASDSTAPPKTIANHEPDGKALFESRCRCHGSQGPKKYRGKSPEIVARALRDSRLKVLSTGKMAHVVGLDDAEIDALARYLSGL